MDEFSSPRFESKAPCRASRRLARVDSPALVGPHREEGAAPADQTVLELNLEFGRSAHRIGLARRHRRVRGNIDHLGLPIAGIGHREIHIAARQPIGARERKQRPVVGVGGVGDGGLNIDVEQIEAASLLSVIMRLSKPIAGSSRGENEITGG